MFALGADFENMAEKSVDAVDDTYPPLKILIIDHNIDFTKFFKKIIRYLGHEAFTAFDGKSGIELAKYIKPDVIFCDIDLLDIHGYEVAEKIKMEVPSFIIALTGSMYEIENGQSFDMFISKPIQTSLLRGIIKQGSQIK